VINYRSDKHSRLVVIVQMWLEGSTTVGRVWETSGDISTTIHGISFHDLRRNIVTYSQTCVAVFNLTNTRLELISKYFILRDKYVKKSH